jgi:hypothetical protein
VEFSYFNIFTQSATKTLGPTSPTTPDWLVMYAPARSGRPRISHTKAWPGKTPRTFTTPRPTDGWIFPHG